MEAFKTCIENGNATILSSAASGKSLIIYLVTQFYKKKTLIIVSTIGLVTQMKNHFKEYGLDVDQHLHCNYEGQPKETDKQILISTWQSIYKEPTKYFDQSQLVIGDEVHGFKAKSLIAIMSNLQNCYYRFGFTGTLDDTEVHKMVIEGLFGPIHQITTTSELVDQGYIAKPEITILMLKHPDEVCKAMYQKDYDTEIKGICLNDDRNNFIKNLILSLKGNTLVLFRYILHGQYIHKIVGGDEIGANLVYGKTEMEIREEIRNFVINRSSSISICSYGCFSTGVDIPNLNNVIFASPYKAKIKVLQSIGRGLRLSDGKIKCRVYDIADDMSWKGTSNYTLKHFISRVSYYNQEGFDYKNYTIKL